jgi:hypothetical protein
MRPVTPIFERRRAAAKATKDADGTVKAVGFDIGTLGAALDKLTEE